MSLVSACFAARFGNQLLDVSIPQVPEGTQLPPWLLAALFAASLVFSLPNLIRYSLQLHQLQLYRLPTFCHAIFRKTWLSIFCIYRYWPQTLCFRRLLICFRVTCQWATYPGLFQANSTMVVQIARCSWVDWLLTSLRWNVSQRRPICMSILFLDKTVKSISGSTVVFCSFRQNWNVDCVVECTAERSGIWMVGSINILVDWFITCCSPLLQRSILLNEKNGNDAPSGLSWSMTSQTHVTAHSTWPGVSGMCLYNGLSIYCCTVCSGTSWAVLSSSNVPSSVSESKSSDPMQTFMPTDFTFFSVGNVWLHFSICSQHMLKYYTKELNAFHFRCFGSRKIDCWHPSWSGHCYCEEFSWKSAQRRFWDFHNASKHLCSPARARALNSLIILLHSILKDVSLTRTKTPVRLV